MLGSNIAVSAAKAGKVKLLIISLDAQKNTKKMVTNTANFYKIPVLECYDKQTLGNAVGKELISVIGIKNESFTEQILKLYSEKIIRGNV